MRGFRMAEEAKSHSAKRIVVGVLLSAVAALAIVLGLHFASIIRLPFLPTTAEIAFALKLDRVVGDGSFDVAAEAAADVSVSVGGNDLKVKTKAQANGSVRDFKRDDPFAFKVVDGRLVLQARPTGFASLLLREPLEASGTFEADLSREIVEYAIEKPLAHEGSLHVDAASLKDAPKGELEVKSLTVEGDTATVVVSGESITKSKAFKSALESLGQEGLAVDAELDDVTVAVHLDEPNDRIEVAIDTSLEASM